MTHQRAEKGLTGGARRARHQKPQALLRPPQLGDFRRHRQERRQARLLRRERNLHRLQDPQAAVRIDHLLFGDLLQRPAFRFARIHRPRRHHFLLEDRQLFVRAAQQLFTRKHPVGPRHRLVGQHEPVFEIFGVDKIRHQVDHLAQPRFRQAERVAGAPPFDLRARAGGKKFEQGEVRRLLLTEGHDVEHRQRADHFPRGAAHRHAGKRHRLQLVQVAVGREKGLHLVRVDLALAGKELLAGGAFELVFETRAPVVAPPKGQGDRPMRALWQAFGHVAIPQAHGLGERTGQLGKKLVLGSPRRAPGNRPQDVRRLGRRGRLERRPRRNKTGQGHGSGPSRRPSTTGNGPAEEEIDGTDETVKLKRGYESPRALEAVVRHEPFPASGITEELGARHEKNPPVDPPACGLIGPVGAADYRPYGLPPLVHS